MSEPDLSLVETHALLEEIIARFDAAAFVGAKDMTEERNRIEMMWKGDDERCRGLIDLTVAFLDPASHEEHDES